MMKKYSLANSFIICVLAYTFAFVAWYCLNVLLKDMQPVWAALIEDVAATLIIFGFSVYFKNASMYDPYWSVIPVYIALQWRMGFTYHPNLADVVICAVLIWAMRLTANWARGWKGLTHEDWRYIMLREKNPGIYWITNLGGIHLFPTVMVFAGMLPVYFTFKSMSQHFNPVILWLGFGICIAATAIEFIADEQMRSFKKNAKPDQFIDAGIWKYSRHPNYFGEISFWFGLWVMQMAVAPEYWFTVIGFIGMLVMFRFASIPMMEEKNRKNKPGYENYINHVSMLIPWFSKA